MRDSERRRRGITNNYVFTCLTVPRYICDGCWFGATFAADMVVIYVRYLNKKKKFLYTLFLILFEKAKTKIILFFSIKFVLCLFSFFFLLLCLFRKKKLKTSKNYKEELIINVKFRKLAFEFIRNKNNFFKGKGS